MTDKQKIERYEMLVNDLTKDLAELESFLRYESIVDKSDDSRHANIASASLDKIWHAQADMVD
jgi:hypothetical protein